MVDSIELTRKLNAFDVTNLVVGSIVGADIYIAAAIGAKMVGPISLLIWMIAGIMAIFIALSFTISASLYPKVGGPYNYAREAFGEVPGFLVGWSLFLAEWLSLAVFPEAFTRYFIAFTAITSPLAPIILKAVFIMIILVTNVVGVKSAGRFNDYLTIGKLAPLALLMLTGLIYVIQDPAQSLNNFHPVMKGTMADIGHALVLIFWAYAGFELSTLPADEVEEPEKTIPRAIRRGMMIVTVFYMFTNFVIICVLDQQTLAASNVPLITASARIFERLIGLPAVGTFILGIGAIVSVMGADESGTLGTSRLAYALSIDGLFPRVFSVKHERLGTPYLGLVILCVTAFIASVTSTLTALINASVFLLAFVYLITCLSALKLEKLNQSALKYSKTIPLIGSLFSLVLISQVAINQIFISLILIGLGVPIYTFFSPKKELDELKKIYYSRGETLRRTYEQGNRFLAHFIRHIKWWIYRETGKERAWKKEEE